MKAEDVGSIYWSSKIAKLEAINAEWESENRKLKDLNAELLKSLKIATAALEVLGADASGLISVIYKAEGK